MGESEIMLFNEKISGKETWKFVRVLVMGVSALSDQYILSKIAIISLTLETSKDYITL